MKLLLWKEMTYTKRNGGKSDWLSFEGFAEPCTAILLERMDVGGVFLGPPPQPSKWKWFVTLPHSVQKVEVLGGDLDPHVAKQQATVTLRAHLRRLLAELEDLP